MKTIAIRISTLFCLGLFASCGGDPKIEEKKAETPEPAEAQTEPVEKAAAAAPEKSTDEEEYKSVSKDLFVVPEGLEVTVWATSPLFYNPTNMDIDKDGRIWVAEGVRYRREFARQSEGDRIVVVEDTDGDGKADSSHTFVQEPLLIAPLGLAVLDNKVVVSQPPHLLVYTDENRDLKFDPEVDKREVLLTGFQGQNHDHSLHSVTAGPDGKWYFNSGNCGGKFTDKSGKTFTIFGSYTPKPIGPFEYPHDSAKLAGTPSDDGHTYVGGFTVRMNPDGTDVEIIGHNYRNSYEQSVTSLGDVFQNDNDDPPACRVSWVMEYANFGFSSNDGKRSWRADVRPGQTTAIAEWRQEDPGITPAGDVYGGGSPTGNVFYENGALGEKWQGTFFACEPGRNVVFAYQPRLNGTAGFTLERTDFLTTNPEKAFAGSDFLGGSDSVRDEEKTLFRPSDISVGPDGALYICDWYDGRVGGHQTLDETRSGTIYRVAPKGFTAKVPQLDLATVEGQIEALKSPAVNVRNLGFTALKEKGRASLDAVAQVLDDSNIYIKGRAIHLLYQLGISGPRKAGYPESYAEPELRIAAFRAMRRAGLDWTGSAIRLAGDEHPAVRREVALAMRDQPFDIAKDILVEIAKGYDGNDRYYLEAFGTGATGKEAEIYAAVQKEMGNDDPRFWVDPFADIAWRLHPNSAVSDLATRARSVMVEDEQRKKALDAIAFVDTREASEKMMEIARYDGPFKSDAVWWLINRASNSWQEFDLMARLKESGIYDPDTIVVQEITTPDPAVVITQLPPVEEILKLKGDPVKGKATIQRCIMCHQVGDTGAMFGPSLNGWGKTQTTEVIIRSIVDPGADIAHSYQGTELEMKDGKMVNGLVLNNGNPTLVTSMGGVTQTIPNKKIKKKKKMKRSLMMSAGQLGLSAQDVADIAAYMKTE
ncbi:MAG: c-type cytochrome [Verrucomicrobiales bacterium]|nr:c-type cytochrome [Verrucomicrobiales bacterium]